MNNWDLQSISTPVCLEYKYEIMNLGHLHMKKYDPEHSSSCLKWKEIERKGMTLTK